jgi:hypothetical protein
MAARIVSPKPDFEPQDPIKAVATAAGNGAHVHVPKGWLGEELVIFRKSDLVYAVRNNHYAAAQGVIGEWDDVIQTTQNQEGEQILLRANKRRRIAEIQHGDYGWLTMPLMRNKDEVVMVVSWDEQRSREPKLVAGGFLQWIEAGLNTAGMDLDDLPDFKAKTELEQIIADLGRVKDPRKFGQMTDRMVELYRTEKAKS